MDALDAFGGSFSDQLAMRATINRMPLSGTFELLPFCNLRCKMCYIVHENQNAYKKEMKNIEFWDRVIDEAVDAGMLYALITGGEPFFYPEIQELLERINKKPIHFAVNTNGTLLNEDTVRWLSKVHPYRLNISLYGGSNETYRRLCGNPKGFEQVIRAFELLNKYNIPYYVHTTLTPYNIMDFDKIKAVCDKYRAPLKMVYYMFPPFRKEQGIVTNTARFSPKEAAEVALRIFKQVYDKDVRKKSLEVYCASFEKPEIYGLYGNDKIACRGGYSTFWVNWRGQVSGCGINDKEHIDLTEHSFSDAWKEIVASTEGVQLSQKCAYCKYRCICPTCAAAAFCETGDVGGTPEYLCEFCEHYANLLRQELEVLRNEHERGLF